MGEQITPGRWVVERWSAKEAQIVAINGKDRSLICAGVLPADARAIVEAIAAWNTRTPSGLSLPESDSADHLGVVIGRKDTTR